MRNIKNFDALLKAMNELNPHELGKESIPILEGFFSQEVMKAKRKTIGKMIHLYKPILKAAESISDLEKEIPEPLRRRANKAMDKIKALSEK